MELDETTLIEIQDYINALDEKVGLKSETVEDVREAINKHRTELKNLRLVAVSKSLPSDVDYWKQRCLLAEQCLEESPCDPDITSDQIKAWNAYHKFISWAGNDR